MNTTDQSRVILDEEDASQLLRILYNGKRPARVHTLICLCGNIADLRKNPKAWNGWQILPTAKCPECLLLPKTGTTGQVEYNGPARARFEKAVQTLLIGEIYA